ncbi:hypothetical protein JWH11_06075 [Xanthomonas melonis]|uniref:Uncharacterized protein n=1 Tax=Xanthomonas melonis TaxID=56456 RepID=A0ABS8NSG9_9XANT|nr:hypothetical protein [Xanthomonas melonis]
MAKHAADAGSSHVTGVRMALDHAKPAPATGRQIERRHCLAACRHFIQERDLQVCHTEQTGHEHAWWIASLAFERRHAHPYPPDPGDAQFQNG